MTEAAAGGGRAGIERRLIERSLADESFRQRLLADPRAIMEQELGVQLPADVQVQAVEETADTIYLVLPSSSSVGEGGELSDQELESVAGGFEGFQTPTFETCNYDFTCHCDWHKSEVELLRTPWGNSEWLREVGIAPSMGRTRSALDYAMAESFASTLKTELVSNLEFPTRQAARTAIFESLETFYNTRLLLSALGYMSPSTFEEDRMEEAVVA